MTIDPETLEAPSNVARHLGTRLTDWRENFARVECPLADFLLNRQGLPHGGIHALLLDTAMGYALSYTGDPQKRQGLLTLSMNVSYLAKAQGNRLICEGWRSGGGRRTGFAEGKVMDAEGRVVATGTGVFRYHSM